MQPGEKTTHDRSGGAPFAPAYFGAMGIAVVGLLLIIALLVLPLLHAP